MNKNDRQLIFNKFDGKCYLCGENLKPGWHADHLVPCRRKYKFAAGINNITKEYISTIELNRMTSEEYAAADMTLFKNYKQLPDGFENPEANDLKNLMPACASCNINKHDMPIESFRHLIQGFMKHLNEINTQYKIAKRYGLIEETEKPIVFYFEKLK